MSQIVLEILIIILLLMANGVCAMTEIAVVSSRKARLKRMADLGDKGAAAALELAQSPNRFLSTVQVGITLVGVLAGAFGGATVAKQIAIVLREIEALQPYADGIGIGSVVLAITFLSLIIGELVPKRLALANPEGIARVMARPMNQLAMVANPVVRLLTFSTDFVLRLIGIREVRDQAPTEEEVKVLMEEGMQAGVFHSAEPRMVESVLSLDRTPVKDIMTPRAKLIFLSQDDPHEAVWHKIVVSGHSNFPVYQGNRDNVVGVISVKSIYANLAANAGVKLANLMVPPLIVPATQPVTKLLDSFRKTGKHIALVADEFGGIIGIVTLVDVLEAIVGDIPSPEERLEPKAKKRDDGSWLVDGGYYTDDLERILPQLRFPRQVGREYETLAGFILDHLGRVPLEGEFFDWLGYRWEIIDMDRHRVDKVLILPLEKVVPPSEPRA
jgi:putative hemolysin